MATSSSMKVLVVMLLVLQAALTLILWLISSTGVNGTDSFAIIFGADLLAFGTVAHLYRSSRMKENEEK